MTYPILKQLLESLSFPESAATSLWESFGSLNRIYQAPKSRLMQLPEVSEPVADYIVNHAKLFTHMEEESLKQVGDILSSPDAVKSFLRHHIAFQDREMFLGIFLTNRNELLHWSILFQGTVDAAPVYPHAIAREALLHNAKAVIVAHNHPGGSLDPSHQDLLTTKRIASAISLLQLSLLDHFILSPCGITSLREYDAQLFEPQL